MYTFRQFTGQHHIIRMSMRTSLGASWKFCYLPMIPRGLDEQMRGKSHRENERTVSMVSSVEAPLLYVTVVVLSVLSTHVLTSRKTLCQKCYRQMLSIISDHRRMPYGWTLKYFPSLVGRKSLHQAMCEVDRSR